MAGWFGRVFDSAGRAAGGLVAAAMLSALSAGSVLADRLYTAEDTAEIVRVLKGYGDVEEITDRDGAPFVKATVKSTEFTVSKIDCKAGGDCRGIKFVASLPRLVTGEKVDHWNRTKRFGRAIRDDLDEVRLELAFELAGGVSKENLADKIDWWIVALSEFAPFLDEPLPEPSAGGGREPAPSSADAETADVDTEPPRDVSGGGSDYSDTREVTDIGLIAEAQEHLSNLDYYSGAVDGQAGSGTQKAIRDVQERLGEPQTGVLTVGLLERLRDAKKPTQWGALAYRAGGGYGSAWGYDTKRKAIDAAVAACAKHGGAKECAKDVMTASGNFCIALAYYDHRKNYGTNAVRRPDITAARADVITNCRDNPKSGGKCSLKTAFCADGSHK